MRNGTDAVKLPVPFWLPHLSDEGMAGCVHGSVVGRVASMLVDTTGPIIVPLVGNELAIATKATMMIDSISE